MLLLIEINTSIPYLNQLMIGLETRYLKWIQLFLCTKREDHHVS